jgi:Transposase DDE domain group 1
MMQALDLEDRYNGAFARRRETIADIRGARLTEDSFSDTPPPGHSDCLAAKLRSGNVSSADDWEELLVPEIDRQQAAGQRVAFRADAAFERPAIYEALETRGVQYAIHIPGNKNLELAIEDLLFRSPGRPSLTPLVRYMSFQYQADSWTTPRRVVAKVEHHVGQLFPRVGCIVTNLALPNRAVVRFYNRRGTAEQWIKEGKQAAHWTRLSCHRFRATEVRLQLSCWRHNLGNLWRRLVLPRRIELVVDQPPAAPRQNGWTAGQARPVLLAPAGGEPSDAPAVRGDAPADLGVARADRLTLDR